MSPLSILRTAAVVLAALLAAWPLAAEDGPKAAFRALSALTLYAPEDDGERRYLGLKDAQEKISLGQISAEILIVEIFTMYCPHCQRHAPKANDLYRAIDSRREFRNRIKMIGIGIGNSPYEVQLFKEKYSPPFPMLDDRNSAVMGAMEGILTPHYLGLRIKNDSTLEVFYSKSGAFSDAEAFLDMIVKESGIQRGGNP